MKSLLAFLAGTILSTHALAASQVAVQLDVVSDGFHWDSWGLATYASIGYRYPDGRRVDFSSEDNVPRVTDDWELEYPWQFGAETGPSFVRLTLPDEASGGLYGIGTMSDSYLILPGESLTISGTFHGSHNLDHYKGSANYHAELTASNGAGVNFSIFDISRSFSDGSSDLSLDFSYTFHNDTDEYSIQYFTLLTNAGIDGAIAPIPEPSTYATMMLGLAALIPASRLTRRKQATVTNG